jgi:replication factor A1
MPRRLWEYNGRGRHPGRGNSDKSIRTLEYLALIAVKYNIDGNTFLRYIKKALDEGESENKGLNIRCRQKNEDSATLLLTVGSDVVAQFPISTGVFQREKQLESYMRTISARKSRIRKILNPKIEDLRAGMKKIHLKAKVLEIPEPNIVYTRLGSSASVSNILISDETGTIRMSLWNKQINNISKGDIIELENGKVASYRGQLQLRIGRKGSLNVIK